ncbi:hypothetical protein SLE2022_398450 [Rubroshorea leprosula]
MVPSDVDYTIMPIYSNTEESQKWIARVSGRGALLQLLVMLNKLQPHLQIVTMDYKFIDLTKNDIEMPNCKATALPPPSSEAAAATTKPEPPPTTTTTTKPNKRCCLM